MAEKSFTGCWRGVVGSDAGFDVLAGRTLLLTSTVSACMQLLGAGRFSVGATGGRLN